MTSNYRPILTVSVFKNVTELIYLRLSEYLTNNNVICDTQFGFRWKCSTTLAVLQLVADLLNSCHNKTNRI